MIKLLEDALMLADDLCDGATGYLIERALDEARAQQFRFSLIRGGSGGDEDDNFRLTIKS